MVAVFSLANVMMAWKLSASQPDFYRYAPAFLLCLFFFFRLRCFDEIKDYEVDLELNPDRPLARGLLSIRQVKWMIAGLTLAEILLCMIAGLSALQAHAIAIVYSFLMFYEFFIGKNLRPHLTTYAVTHTFVATFLGWSIAVYASALDLTAVATDLFWLAPINWSLFNLFEFARKTFAKAEERSGADSYSSLFKPIGAVLLSFSQIMIALLVVWHLQLPGLHYQLIAAGFPIFSGLFYAWQPKPKSAAWFRNISSVYLLLFYILLAYQSYIS